MRGRAAEKNSPARSTSHIRYSSTNAEKALRGCRKWGGCVQTILRDPINTRPPTPRGRKEQDIKKMKRKNTKKKRETR
ncbi:hypothetical protein TNCV_1627081 [Trichonephila clavipes]|nr:hypothetical protein TNCV_1627081 [Trichonephila clavipes]